jgi:predicted phage baseplate assembly protein
MPLSAALPQIDNRRFDDLVAEARTRIPRYTPEWTDYNPGDAGFALVELFAWMTELLTYRLAQVPELNYLKFLELIGIELAPAKPAEAILVFPVQKAFADAVVQVPARTQVSAAPSDGGDPVVFETTAAISALRGQLEAVQVYDGYNYADVTADNADADSPFAPFGRLANPDSALLLGFGADIAIPAGTQISLAFWPENEGAGVAPAPCTGEAAAIYASATLAWEYWNGIDWSSLTLLKDETLAFTRLGFVVLRAPAKGELAAAKIGAVKDKNRFWLRARVVTSSYEEAPSLSAIRANAAPAVSAQTVQNEVLGGSNGDPGQVFALSSAPVLDGTLVLQVDEGDGFVTWTEVDDFAGADEKANVYVLNRTTGEVRFGDGVNGHIPVANLNKAQTNIVALSYRFGGGKRANVDAGTITTLMTSLTGIDAGKVSNPFAADGGTDEESLEAAKARAPEALKSRDRAVTAEDFELLAKQAGPIARAKALPLNHPDFPGMQVPGVVTVIVVPDVDGATPTPSAGLLRTVCAYLDKRRIISTELYVIAPTYVPVSVSVTVVPQSDADTSEVSQAVEESIATFLSPLKGGAKGDGWPFGGTIFYGDLYRAALAANVQRVQSLTVTLDGEDYSACSDVPIPAGTLLNVTGVTVTIDNAEDA